MIDSKTLLRFSVVRLLVIIGWIVASGAVAFADQGVIEINNAVVQQQGGFPYMISSPGSYRLTGNLNGSAGTDVIDVNASPVSIDLNGFSILSGKTGINGASAGGVTVRNGTISGMIGDGIDLGANATVEHLSSAANAGNGIVVGGGSRVEHNTVANNGAMGIIVAGSGSSVIDNVVVSNGGPGDYGLDFQDQTTAYAGNMMFGNGGIATIGNYSGQIKSGGGTQIGQNLCNGNVCP
jgi:hypothetical protein